MPWRCGKQMYVPCLTGRICCQLCAVVLLRCSGDDARGVFLERDIDALARASLARVDLKTLALIWVFIKPRCIFILSLSNITHTAASSSIPMIRNDASLHHDCQALLSVRTRSLVYLLTSGSFSHFPPKPLLKYNARACRLQLIQGGTVWTLKQY